MRLGEADAGAHTRIDAGLGELNRVLGGGLVAGCVVLLGGEAGVGKSTLLLQSLLSMEGAGVPTLLASGEESAAPVKGESVLKYAPDSQAAKAYRQLAREVLNGKKI